MTADMNVDFIDPDSIDRLITAMQAQYLALVAKTERGEPLSAPEVLSIAHWVGIAQGTLSERSTALRASRPLNHRAQVMSFYVKEHERKLADSRTEGEACVLRATEAISLGILHLWAADDNNPLRRAIAQAELFRRGQWPDPQTDASALSERQASAAERVGFPHLADAIRQRAERAEQSQAPLGPSQHPEKDQS